MDIKNGLRGTLRLLLCFLLTASVLIGFLLLSAIVPRESIRPQMLTSAEYLYEGKLFGDVIPGVASSRIDRYADSILLGIAWQFDSQNPLRSVMVSSYFHLVYQNENENLRDAVVNGFPANHQYLRYWHGSAGIVRILMIFLTLPQIYIFHAVLLGILLFALVWRLFRRGAFPLIIGMLVGMAAVSLWFVPLSLEYTWVFLILFVQMHLVLFPVFPKDWNQRSVFFLVSGMVTNYLDFLTTETLTLLVPLLFVLFLDHREARGKVPWLMLFKSALCWLMGYGGMFLLKWGLAGLVMGENPLPYVMDHVGERIAGSVGVSFFREQMEILFRNISCLFPLNYGPVGNIAGILIVLAVLYVCCVYHRKGVDRGLVARYVIVALIPYLRYLVMANHSYLHYFFTYRAQAATILAVVLLLYELIFEKTQTSLTGVSE